MEYGKLEQSEFSKRCKEVFWTQDGEEFYDIRVKEDGAVCISMSEIGDKSEQFRIVYFDYEPNMSERPEALAYLLGERDDFND